MIPVFVGYDPLEVEAYHVLCQSIFEHATEPVSITPIKREMLGFSRPRGLLDSTEFSITRFLVPHLMKFKGHAIFMDCDMMFRDDIAKLWAYKSDGFAVQVVKHDYETSTDTKMLDQDQTRYQFKNWSSLMLINCGWPGLDEKLSKANVEREDGLWLHQFEWTYPHLIGSLPSEWNWLVGEYPYNESAKNVHWTLGGPWWEQYVASEYANEWRVVRARMLNLPTQELRRHEA